MIEIHVRFTLDKFLILHYKGDFQSLEAEILYQLDQSIRAEAQKNVGEEGSYKFIGSSRTTIEKDTFASSVVYGIDAKIERIVIARKIYII